MIIRDENGRALGVENLSDLTDEISEIEKILNQAHKNKKKGKTMPPEEKESLKCRIEDLKVLMNSASEEIKNGANAMQIIALIKEMAKLKKITEKLAECINDD
ncbi:MAG: hypothetical protein UH249_11725 [Acutalibacteraceae bacterium]|nr:hypothetical protein [Acutalibacteraceae bacterium]